MYKKEKKDNRESSDSAKGVVRTTQKASSLKKGKGTSKFKLKIHNIFSKNILKR